MRAFVTVLSVSGAIGFAAAGSAIAQPPPPDCLVGYPDGAFRGERVLTRYAFAAGANACLEERDRRREAEREAVRADLERLRQQLEALNDQLGSSERVPETPQ